MGRETKQEGRVLARISLYSYPVTQYMRLFEFIYIKIVIIQIMNVYERNGKNFFMR